MRWWIAFGAKLYPRRWRERYGAEFDALMEDVEPDWRELANVLGGALKMQIRSETAYWKLAAVMAAVGAVVALGLSLRVPERYESSAVLRYTPSAQADERKPPDTLEMQKQELLSRNLLAYLITSKGLNLYESERRHISLDEAVVKMRSYVHMEQTSSADGGPVTLRVSFTYPDKAKARAVTQEFMNHFLEVNTSRNYWYQRLWRDTWQEDAPAGSITEVVAPPSDPRTGEGPNRLAFAAVGSLMGALLASSLRHPRIALQLGAFAVGAAILAVGASYLIPRRYTSTAVMRISPALDSKRWFAGRTPESPAEHIKRLENVVTSSLELQKIILGPSLKLYPRRSLNLYPKERATVPIADVARTMRDRDLRIEFIAPAAVSVSFTYGDAKTAQAVVREIVTGFTEQNIIAERARVKIMGPEFQRMTDHKVGENLEVLDPATFPQTPDGPDRLLIVAAGVAAGLLLGALTLILRRPRGSAPGTAVPAPAV
jgi:hypothetical protein